MAHTTTRATAPHPDAAACPIRPRQRARFGWRALGLLVALAWIPGQDPPRAQPVQGEPGSPTAETLVEPAETLVELDARDQSQLEAQASEAEVEDIVSETAALDARLRSVFAADGVFEGLDVESTRAGVVVLAGTALSRKAADSAVALAEKIKGVLIVVDRIEVDKSLSRRLHGAWGQALEQLEQAVSLLPLLGIAALILFAAVLLGRLLAGLEWPYRLVSGHVLLQNLLRQTVSAGVVILGLMAALQFLDAGAVIGTVLGAAGVLGLAFGFAFRDIVENYLSGILLAIRRPFVAKDLIEVVDTVGTVIRMTASDTTLLDADGNHLRIPNSAIFKNKVRNFTRNPLRRFSVSVGVAVDVDLVEAQNLGLETLRSMPGVVQDPAPSVILSKLGDSDVKLEFYGWVDQRASSFIKVSSQAVRLVKTALDDAGVDMPIPAYQVLVQRAGPKPAQSDSVSNARPPGEDLATLDVSPDVDIDKQVEHEISQSDESDLLDDSSG